MKAIDYFDTYRTKLCQPLISSEEATEVCKTIFFKFCDETKKLAEIRHVKEDAGLISIIKEQNDKWNCLVRILQKKHGMSVLKEDGFAKFWEHEIKGLKVTK